MVKRFTQSSARCVRPSPHRRADTARIRSRMPAAITPEVRAKIRDACLREQLSNGSVTIGKVRETLLAMGVVVSRSTLDKEAYAMEVAGQIQLNRQTGGRPKLSDGQQGKTWSPNRQKVMELHEQGLKVREIVVRTGMTRQGVERIIKAAKLHSVPSTNESK